MFGKIADCAAIIFDSGLSITVVCVTSPRCHVFKNNLPYFCFAKLLIGYRGKIKLRNVQVCQIFVLAVDAPRVSIGISISSASISLLTLVLSTSMTMGALGFVPSPMGWRSNSTPSDFWIQQIP